MLFILYPPCMGCQKAKKWLDEHGLEYTARHIKQEPPTYEELKDWYSRSGLPLKRFFNTMELKDKIPAMTEEEQLRLLAQNAMLVKRPIIIKENTIFTGFKPEEWEKLL